MTTITLQIDESKDNIQKITQALSFLAENKDILFEIIDHLEAIEDIKKGNIKTFSNIEDLIDDLDN